VPDHTLANLIAGREVAPASGAYLDNVEPATGLAYSRIPASDARDVQAAVEAAGAAFPAWSKAPAAERSGVLLRLASLIDANLEDLARAESIDSGKPIALARTLDIPRAASNFRFFASAILHTQSAFHETDAVGPQGAPAMNYTLRRPRGIAGCISPWNLPLYLFTWKIAPALATGNTVVAKPSEVTPMTASMLGRLAGEAGLPPGVLNIVHGTGPDAGGAIVTHPDVPTISFTGSTAVGKWIAASAGPMFKRLSLELGGKNASIVFADADLDRAAAECARAAFLNQGQICLCGSRILVERAIYEPFLERVVAAARAIRIGDPLEEGTQHGALSSKQHLEKVESYVQLARELGGKVECGGSRPDLNNERCRGGYFFEPTVITGLEASCRVEQEEIFGPVVTISPFEREEQAVSLANCTPYGLAASIWTRDLSRAHRVAAAVEAGIIWVNCWLVRDLRTPFGGMKQSGVGREGGDEALRFFTEPKNVCVRL
jgi:aminomuconate-semialdehyde/2-hydroxymuconate-6-semialdehyde dehydrogenase